MTTQLKSDRSLEALKNDLQKTTMELKQLSTKIMEQDKQLLKAVLLYLEETKNSIEALLKESEN